MNRFDNLVVLFDLDGTLVDSAPGVAWSLNIALKEEGRGPLSVARIKDLVGQGAVHLVADALKDTGGMESEAQRDRLRDNFLQIYSENPIQDTIVFPGVIEALEMLSQQSVPMALCTNKPKKTTTPVLDAFGLSKYFPVVLSGDKVEHKKPDGRHLHATLEALSKVAELGDRSPIMVGDSENDIFAAHDAKVPSICVSFGYCHLPIDQVNPTVVIDHFNEFPAALAEVQEFIARS